MEAKGMKKEIKRSRRKKPVSFLAVVAAVLLFLGAAGVTLAYLTDDTDPVQNVFTPGTVTPEVKEDYEDGLKSHVYIQNTANVRAYIRVSVVAENLKEDFDKTDSQKLSTEITGPFLHTDYNEETGEPVDPLTQHFIEEYLNGSGGTAEKGWIKYEDGYYYYPEVVEPDAYTNDLLKTPIPVFSVWEQKDEEETVLSRKVLYNHQVTILAEAIQADGKTEAGKPAVVDAWGVDPSTLGN